MPFPGGHQPRPKFVSPIDHQIIRHQSLTGPLAAPSDFAAVYLAVRLAVKTPVSNRRVERNQFAVENQLPIGGARRRDDLLAASAAAFVGHGGETSWSRKAHRLQVHSGEQSEYFGRIHCCHRPFTNLLILRPRKCEKSGLIPLGLHEPFEQRFFTHPDRYS